MSVADFRTIALSMPEAVESAHMDHPDFRVGGKVFASLFFGGADKGMVKLTPAQQAEFIDDRPDVFEPIKGAWGKRGATQVNLNEAAKTDLRRALIAAWRNTAPKKLIDELDGARPGRR